LTRKIGTGINSIPDPLLDPPLLDSCLYWRPGTLFTNVCRSCATTAVLRRLRRSVVATIRLILDRRRKYSSVAHVRRRAYDLSQQLILFLRQKTVVRPIVNRVPGFYQMTYGRQVSAAADGPARRAASRPQRSTQMSMPRVINHSRSLLETRRKLPRDSASNTHNSMHCTTCRNTCTAQLTCLRSIFSMLFHMAAAFSPLQVT